MAKEGSNGRSGHTKPFTDSDLGDTEIRSKGEKMSDLEDSELTPWQAVLESIDNQDQLVEEGSKALIDALDEIGDPGISLLASLLHVQIMATMNVNSTLRWMLTAMIGEAEEREEDGEA